MKRYIMGMSIEVDRAKQRMKAYAPVIMEHIIKLVMYSDIRPDDIDGWILSVAKWIQAADDITLKPNAKKPKKDLILSTLFMCMGDSINDYRGELYAFLADNRSGKFNHGDKESYPEFEVTDEAAETIMNVCYDIINATVPLLTDKMDHSVADYTAVIRPIFEALV